MLCIVMKLTFDLLSNVLPLHKTARFIQYSNLLACKSSYTLYKALSLPSFSVGTI